jgi:hypothetical protein
VSGPYIFRFDEADREERRRALEVEHEHLQERYRQHLVTVTGLDSEMAGRVIAALFDHRDRTGGRCLCGCHPRLSSDHGDGFDCRCTWNDERIELERARWEAFWKSPGASKLSARHEAEERDIASWLAWQPGVEARRLTSYAPEQWEGTVDGHSFFFRERHGEWRLDLDPRPTGETLERLVDVADDGELLTEHVPAMQGKVVAEGLESQLGESPVDHLAFIVVRVREYLRGEACRHEGARLYCPECGRRVG